MTAFNKDTSKDANDAQKKKYPDLSAEMRRRAAMRKTFGTGGFRHMIEHDPERFREIIEEREAKRKERDGDWIQEVRKKYGYDQDSADGRAPADQ